MQVFTRWDLSIFPNVLYRGFKHYFLLLNCRGIFKGWKWCIWSSRQVPTSPVASVKVSEISRVLEYMTFSLSKLRGVRKANLVTGKAIQEWSLSCETESKTWRWEKDRKVWMLSLMRIKLPDLQFTISFLCVNGGFYYFKK